MASTASGAVAGTGAGRWNGGPVQAWLARTSAFERFAYAALVLGVICRLAVFRPWPLWFDEVFTATIATQPDLASLFRWTQHEVGGPLYYLIAWLWQHVAGASNTALRLPSLAFSVGAIALAARTRVLDHRQRLALAALVALLPSAYFDTPNARSYTMLLFMALWQMLGFIALMQRPGMRQAFAWTGLSTLALLTHYHMASVCLAQGLIYLAVHRMAALRTWPAMVLVLPVPAWLYLQYQVLSLLATPGNNWFTLLEWPHLLLLPRMIFPFGYIAYPVVFAALAGFGYWYLSSRNDPARLGPARQVPAAGFAVLAGAMAIALVVGIGMIVPSFISRYLIPAYPAMLLGIALWVLQVERIASRYAGYVILILAASSLSTAALLATNKANRWTVFNFERASHWIMRHGDPQRVVFFWDNRTGDVSYPAELAEVGGFFFRRAGSEPRIVLPRNVGKDGDPNLILPALAGTDGKGAFIWLADTDVPGTRASNHPERLSRDPAWRCEKYGSDAMIMLACLPAR